METEQLSAEQIDAGKKAIAQAESLIDSMNMLKKRLHLSDGCGQRFLQRTNPDITLLQKAEQEIAETYSGMPQQRSQQQSSSKKTELLNNIARRGQA